MDYASVAQRGQVVMEGEGCSGGGRMVMVVVVAAG